MKKTLAIGICAGLIFTMSGCSLGTALEQLTSTGDTSAENHSKEIVSGEVKPRVYIDELSGKLQDFNGKQLTVSTEEEIYVFDVSNATLECADGMITGDIVSVIYEGQLSDTDTSTVKALKVVDEFHKKGGLKERTAHGEVINLSPNTITIKSRNGKTATYPITGTEQYYQNGIQKGSLVYLHFKGKFPEDAASNPMVLNASHLKVLSISDIDPIKLPEPTPTPEPSQGEQKEKQFSATIQNVTLNILEILPMGKTTPLNLDIASIPSYFKGGIAPGSHVNVTYHGELKEDTLEGISVLAVTGEDPDTLKNRNVSFTASGTIIGSTANTVTIQTTDGAVDTFHTDSAQNYSESEFAEGSVIRVTFHPAESKTSNIYTAVKIEDA